MRKPIQCEGVERGSAKTAQIAVAGSVNPAFGFGDILGVVGPVLKNSAMGAFHGATGL